jgi:hypothetical protein
MYVYIYMYTHVYVCMYMTRRETEDKKRDIISQISVVSNSGDHPLGLRFPAYVSSSLQALITSLLSINTINRLGSHYSDFKQIQTHPFFNHIQDWQQLLGILQYIYHIIYIHFCYQSLVV